MKKLEFIADLHRAAPRIGLTVVGNWMRLAAALEDAGVTLTPEQAGQWDLQGFLPEEAGPLILSGITPERQAELERHEAEQAGGADALLDRRILGILAQAGWYGPGDVVRVQDPLNPDVEIIVPRDLLGP